MRILIAAALVAALVLSVWPLIALSRWTRLQQSRETLCGWEPAVVIPAHAVAAFLWLWIFMSLPWTFYVLGSYAGGLWIIPSLLLIGFLFILIPGGLVILDAAWLRLHPMADRWTLGRIWGVAGLIFLSSFVLADVFKGYEVVAVVLVSLLFFTVVTWLFLTAWWVLSHPLPSE